MLEIRQDELLVLEAKPAEQSPQLLGLLTIFFVDKLLFFCARELAL